MTVSTSEDESRRGPPNFRLTSEIGKPLQRKINKKVKEESKYQYLASMSPEAAKLLAQLEKL